MKKAISIILSIVLLVGTIGFTPSFEQKAYASTDNDIFSYSIIDGEVTITGCEVNAEGEITIPNKLDRYPVTKIGDYAFKNCGNITSVIIPQGVKSIGVGAFKGCFYLSLINIPESVTTINNNAFDGCALASITLPSGLITIGDSSFRGCAITEITIPSSVTNIGENVFDSCAYLNVISVNTGNAYYSSLDGVLFNKNMTKLIRYPNAKSGEYTIPSSVTTICNYAFAKSTKITKVNIPVSVNEIEDYAFYNCIGISSIDLNNSYFTSVDGILFNKNLTTLIQCPAGKNGDYSIPSSVVTLGSGAFGGCKNLTSITIPQSVTKIGDYAFAGAKPTAITIPDSVTSIGSYAFSGSGLTSITLSNNITDIKQGTFNSCGNLKSVTIPYGVTSIGSNAFYYCNGLTAITIPDSVISVGSNAFYNTPWLNNNRDSFITAGRVLLKYQGRDISVTIPSTIVSISDKAFYECNYIDTVTIPESVTGICDYVFSGSSIISIIIPSSVKSIGNYCFYDCYDLATVTIANGLENIGEYAFSRCHSLESIAIPGSVKSIGNKCFLTCANLSSITISEGVENIGDNAFANCDSLNSITIPSSIKSIANTAFLSCENLTDINVDLNNPYYSSFNGILFTKDKSILIICPEGKSGDVILPSGVKTINNDSFYHCYNLDYMEIPETVTTIGNQAFDNCYFSYISVNSGNNYYSSLNGLLFNKDKTEFIRCPKGLMGAVVLPDSVTAIKNNSLDKCSSVNSVVIPGSVTNIGDLSLYDCSELRSLIICDGVKSIGDLSLNDCLNLTAIVIPDSVKNIGLWDFTYASNDTTIYGKAGTLAEAFAIQNNKLFKSYGSDEIYGMNITSVSYDTDLKSIDVLINIANIKHQSITPNLCLAVFDYNGKLLCVKNEKFNINVGGLYCKQVPFLTAPQSGYVIKAFLWNDLNQMQPLAEPVEDTIQIDI